MTSDLIAQEFAQRLLAPLPRPQMSLLTLLGEVHEERQVWPIWQYVDEHMAREGHDAAHVVATLPSIPGSGPQAGRYTLISYGGQVPPGPDQRIRPTVAGLAHLPRLEPVTKMFLRSITVLVSLRNWAHFDPDKVTDVTVSNADLINQVGVDLQRWLPLLPELLQGEPGVWLTQQVPGDKSLSRDHPGWYDAWRPGKFLDRFAGCASVEEYLVRMADLWHPPSPPSPLVAPSPLGLANALDYLDVVWRLKFGRRLLVLPGAEKTTRLAFDAGSAEEFDSRLSALGDILSALDASGLKGTSGGHAVQRIFDAMPLECPGVDRGRLDRAHPVLKAAIDLRNGLQHHGKDPQRVVDALSAFGLPYPVLNHTTAWRTITPTVVEALNTLREAIQATLK